MVHSHDYGINVSRDFTYDYDNMPTSIAADSGNVISQYDSFGMRATKTVPGIGTTKYIGQIYECSGAGCTKYIFAGMQRMAEGTHYYHSDHLGSSTVLTDDNGDKVQEVFYYPFGEIHSISMSDITDYLYTGKEWDAETGLYYYGARYYDPKLARFISADTIVPEPFHPQSFNRYAYARNNPIVLVDLDGHCEGYAPTIPSDSGGGSNNPTTGAPSPSTGGPGGSTTNDPGVTANENGCPNVNGAAANNAASTAKPQGEGGSTGEGEKVTPNQNVQQAAETLQVQEPVNVETPQDNAVLPIQNSDAQVTSWYLRESGELHGGIDIAGVPRGTGIYNIYTGDVDFSGKANGYGNMVSIHVTEGPLQGLNMRYGHMDAPSPLGVGTSVKAGELIGTVGNSGTVATHLHIDAGLGIFTPRSDRINLDATFRNLYP